ncbi:uncharacterized protein LOC134210317 [Armigeres subalbatus]|uniref:uncharacterized protein LOC134210317 n=1 Tax=Armigeres subalbatus TaxID=124917 RepID=UPI002ED4BABE
MVLRSGNRKQLKFPGNGVYSTPPPNTTVPSISHQKSQQEAAQLENKMAANIEALSRCCETTRGKINRIRNAIETADHDYQRFNIHALRLYMKTVDSAYEEYNDFQNKIYLADPSRKDEFEPKFIEFEELYEFSRISLCQMIDAHENTVKQNQLSVAGGPGTSAQSSGSSGNQFFKLSPTIVLQQAALPSFDGRYDHWFKFKQMFRDIADKCTGDSAATKLHYLDKALIGKAQGAIDPQIIRDNDYEGAWKSLTEQFENLPSLISDTIMKLLNLKAMTNESYQQLKSLVDEVEKCIGSLEFHQLKMDKLSEAIVITLISTKLDQDTRNIWESNVKRGKLPIYKDMIAVLRNQQHVLERCESYKSTQKSKGQPFRTTQIVATKAHTVTIQKSDECPICSDAHGVEKCSAFKTLAVNERYEKAKQLGLCYSCLKKGHRTSNCKTNAKCPKCSRRHHMMLHQEEQTSLDNKKPTLRKGEEIDSTMNATAKPEADVTVANCSLSNNTITSPKHVLLATAIVYVFDMNGEQHKCRVLLDSGAMTNFVSQRLADLLQLKKNFVNVPVTGVNGMKTLVKFKVQCKVKSRVSDSEFCLDYLVVPKVTSALPVTRLNVKNWPIPSKLQLADPTFFEPSRIDMLVGAEAFFDLLLSDKIRMSVHLPVLQESLLGWLVSGPVDATVTVCTVRSFQVATFREMDMDLNHILKRFWAVDNQSSEPEPKDNECEMHFLETFDRARDGRYVVRLPFRAGAVGELGDSRQQAEKRFYQLERRLNKDPQLKKLYSDFINEYLALGHCRVLDYPMCNDETGYYMPHHCVLRPESSTTRLRVVFDASAKSASGHSLNDLLMVGPPVQDNLFDIVLRFRLYTYAFTADVSKMYRMVDMHPSDTKYQRILWREDSSKPLKELELSTVTYGTAAAPFLATRCLNQLAEDEKECFPEASYVVKKGVYVDDVLSGAATLEKAKQLQNDLIAMLCRGGFQLHKWCANDPGLLENIPVEKQEKVLDFRNHDVNETIKTLGLLWNPIEDCFTFRVNHVEDSGNKVTKRQVMSEIARLFDPLGLLAPVIVIAKMVMQDLWRSGLDWDDGLSQEQLDVWNKVKNELPDVGKMKIPRLVTVSGIFRLL